VSCGQGLNVLLFFVSISSLIIVDQRVIDPTFHNMVVANLPYVDDIVESYRELISRVKLDRVKSVEHLFLDSVSLCTL
jgi:hypothetical protein